MKKMTYKFLIPAFIFSIVQLPVWAQSNTTLSSGNSNMDLLMVVLTIIAVAMLVPIALLGKAIMNVALFSIEEEKKKSKGKIIALIVGFMIFSSFQAAYAQNVVTNTGPGVWFYALMGIILIESLVVIMLLSILNKIGQQMLIKPPVLKVIVTTETEPLLLDHDYDGIKELDNDLPPWWKYLFYLTIVFAVAYLFYYHISKNGDLQIAEYEKEVKTATDQASAMKLSKPGEMIDEKSVKLLTDAAELQKGKTIYTTSCSPCHGQLGEGGVGPNFTDNFWIHGNTVSNLFIIIRDGVPDKGMVAWKQLLNPQQIQQVSSYIKSLKGTNPPNPKVSQGTEYKE